MQATPLREADYHAGKWNGLGGKLELDESPIDGAVREFKEESGVDVHPEALVHLGVLQFPNFKAHKNEDWLVYLFKLHLTDLQAEQVVRQSDEGELHWIPQEDLLKLNLWPGDRHFIPAVLANEVIFATLWYDGPNVARVQRRSVSFAP